MPFQKGHSCINTGRTRFKKGHIPWCKGTKGICKGWNKGHKLIKKCKNCGKEFRTFNSSIKRNGGKFCSLQCIGKYKSKITPKKIMKCKKCAKKFIILMSDFRKNLGKFCSSKCRTDASRGKKFSEKHRKKLSIAKIGKYNGNKHPNWKGGKSKENYIMIYSPNHPRKDKHGYMPEHRLAMEKHLGRYLKITEIVHHINENKYNNNINNLMLFPSNSAHIRYHWSKDKE